MVAVMIALSLATAALALAQPTATPSHGHIAEIRGIRMYYETYGAGSPLLLIHGGAGNGMQFEKQIPAFAPHYQLILPDCRAQGRTTDRPGNSRPAHGSCDQHFGVVAILQINDAAALAGWLDQQQADGILRDASCGTVHARMPAGMISNLHEQELVFLPIRSEYRVMPVLPAYFDWRQRRILERGKIGA
jgi:hypothetical protein